MQKLSEYYPPYLKWSDEITPQPVGELLNYAVKNFPYKTAIDFFNKPTGYAVKTPAFSAAAFVRSQAASLSSIPSACPVNPTLDASAANNLPLPHPS